MSKYKNFGFTRKAGILIPVSSLPSKYGIGGFGKSAFDFIDFLRATGQRCWQVLPLNPTSYGDSPYQSPASSAGNPYFIDLDVLVKKKLLTKDEVALQRNNSKIVNYGWLYSTRYDILRVDLEIQEFMIVPRGLSAADAIRAGSEIYHTLATILKKRGLSTAVGDEGGFAPNLKSDEEAIELLIEAIGAAGYSTDTVGIALDCAASEWYENGRYRMPKSGAESSAEQLIEYYSCISNIT